MQHVDSDNNSSDYEAIFQDDFTDIDSSSDIEEILNSYSDEENKLLYLTKTGYSEVEASIAMKKCGSDSSITELTDFICADQLVKTTDTLLPVEDQITQRTLPEDAIGSSYFYYEQIHLSNLMIGFGVHTKPDQITQRTLPEDAIRAPYFYYENVALAPVNVWTGISQKCQIDRKDLNKIVPLESDEVEILLEIAFYCLGIPLKTDVQELNDDRLEQLMSRFVDFDLVIDDIHNLLKDIMGIILTKKVIGIEEVSMMYQDLSQHHGITRVQRYFLIPESQERLLGCAVLHLRSSLMSFVAPFNIRAAFSGT
ncbi:DNA (Cytosine-5)-methyltransferase DRM1/2 isoform 4 [Hibiscus syriacus]|uniref:DNA (Cytosine-5)-methyltransferase DRM1/2 isoform 4 n=1 Tax=Hibiscus syriacus TaxID=106335 RepID=A0A6A2YBM9_HIBSY|nr:DNA (Cytosine-5)-methyltransferase DRM1/2 isoform 4 [Hibiscus syriacus]